MRLALLFAFFAALSRAQEPAPPEFTSDDFFHPGAIQDIYIDSPYWATLQENFNADTYYAANIRWRGQTIYNAGIRSKGRTSRRAAKPSLKVDFARFDSQTFLGLKSFALDNMIQDFTLLKERAAMLLFREMGIPVPRETHARVFINGEYLGLYVLMESIDKRFLQRNFGEDSGYLYEVELQDKFYLDYRGDDPELYTPFPFIPETHESDPQPGPIVEMIKAVNLTSDAGFAAAVSQYIDVKKYLTQVAVENYITEFDGITAAYGVNNVYFYRFAGQSLGMFLPKDKDNAFNAADWPVLLNADLHPLMRRALSVPAWRKHYLDELLRVAAIAGGPGGWLETEFVRLADQIRPDAYLDAVKECPDGACSVHASNYYFEVFVNFVVDQIRTRPTYIEAEVARLAAGDCGDAAVAAFRSTGRTRR